VDWVLNSQPNPETTARVFRETILSHALAWGNGYAEIERSGSGQPIALWLLPPDRTCVERDEDGNLWYVVYSQTGVPYPLPARDVFHLKGLGFDGVVGYSVVRLAAQSLGLSMAQETNAASFFGNSSRPAGVLEMPGQLTEPARETTRREWERIHQGPAKANRIAVLDQGMKFSPMTMPNNESQLLESRKLSVTEMSRWLIVPPHKLGDLEYATFSNIEEQNIDFVINSLMYWINGFEEEADIKLFGSASQGRLFTKLNVKALLRGNTAAQQAFITAMLDRGVFNVNMALEYLDMDPIGKEGDKRLVPMNMQLLKDAGEEPAPAPPAISDGGDDPEAAAEDADVDEGDDEAPRPAPRKKMAKKKVTKRARRKK
jgi:HK97 family phage portal protein